SSLIFFTVLPHNMNKSGYSNSSFFFLCSLIFSILLLSFSPRVHAARNPISVSESFNDGVGLDDYPPTGPNPCHDPRHPCHHPPPPVVVGHRKLTSPASASSAIHYPILYQLNK
ncbi:hypothetical protein LINPERHAP1_LOCUS25533, partial [Linum perenne]